MIVTVTVDVTATVEVTVETVGVVTGSVTAQGVETATTACQIASGAVTAVTLPLAPPCSAPARQAAESVIATLPATAVTFSGSCVAVCLLLQTPPRQW